MTPRFGRSAGCAAGFTMLEALVSTAVLAVVLGALFHVAAASQNIFRTQPRTADMQQRARVAADMLYRDLLMAGAGRSDTPGGGLTHFLPPIAPARRGLRDPDPELSFFTDRVSILYIGQTRAATRLLADMAGTGADLEIDAGAAGCPSGGACGFVGSTRALIFDPLGPGAGYDVFTVTRSAGGFLAHAPPNRVFSRAYRTGALVAAVEEHVYYHDRTNRRLMHCDGYLTDVPLVDEVVGLSFAYLIDPDPRSIPPPAPHAFSCVYEYDDGEPAESLLSRFDGSGPRMVSGGELTDGPVCGSAPNRFDGDLLRLRQVRVMIRVRLDAAQDTDDAQGAAASDYTIRFDVTPRNLNLIR